jgi:hypothetical protein
MLDHKGGRRVFLFKNKIKNSRPKQHQPDEKDYRGTLAGLTADFDIGVQYLTVTKARRSVLTVLQRLPSRFLASLWFHPHMS